MAKPYRIPDYRKLYPEASEEVIAVLRTTERKMQYQEYGLKAEQIIVDQVRQTVEIIPSREDSYDRLLDMDVQFQDSVSAEDLAIRNLQVRHLYKALSFLSDDERYLMEQLYFYGRTERDLAKELGICRNAVHKRKLYILKNLKKFLEKF